MPIRTLDEKFQHGLGDIYDAEHQFLEAQREMLPQAQSQQVQKLLDQHITQTEQQIRVLEQVFAALGVEPKRGKCQGATGIVAENRKTLKEVATNPSLIDLAIAGGSSKVEHYEMSCYRALVTMAEQTGQTKVARLLQKNLAQEEQTASKLEASLPKLLQAAMKSAAAAQSTSSVGATKKAAGAKTAGGAKASGSKSMAATAGATNASGAGDEVSGVATTAAAGTAGQTPDDAQR